MDLADLQIEPRPLRLEWPAGLPTYWNRGQPYRTHFLNGLSLMFPHGEQAFIDSVREFRDQNDDPKLDADIRGFIGQEGWHRYEHAAYNAHLERSGYPTKKLEDRILRIIQFNRRHTRPKDHLALTVCLEHYTAIMAEAILSHPQWLADMHPHFRRIWIWHAVEELEHKAVAFDLYQKIGGGYRRRVITMLLVSLMFPFDMQWNAWSLIRKDGKLWSPRVWQEGFNFMFGRDPGLVWKILPAWRQFFRRDFYPWQHDSRELIAQGKSWLAALDNKEYA
ncbi:metal-dependent hydrolase [Chitinivorax sp. PXF-14]|uniref:metal-dependent hydrolase n=1 Tax=Chitinivorax sp. PXF-14 TaxID=3230488 RepID=UPI0034677BC4